MDHITMIINGKEYVALPSAEYRKLQGRLPSAQEDGIAFARATLGRDLQLAREHAGLTQGELAARLGKSQTLVSRAESGEMRVSERYVALVLTACRLPKDWAPPSPAKARGKLTKTQRKPPAPRRS